MFKKQETLASNSFDLSGVIFNLAVLRAAVEGVRLGTYFGSTAELDHWIAVTQNLGWIDADNSPTAFGQELARALNLSAQEPTRAYLWWKSSELVAKAKELQAAHVQTAAEDSAAGAAGQ